MVNQNHWHPRPTCICYRYSRYCPENTYSKGTGENVTNIATIIVYTLYTGLRRLLYPGYPSLNTKS